MVVAMVMVIRGAAANIEDAFEAMRQHRPKVHYQPAQAQRALAALAIREKRMQASSSASKQGVADKLGDVEMTSRNTNSQAAVLVGSTPDASMA
jgi:hypothetical protein